MIYVVTLPAVFRVDEMHKTCRSVYLTVRHQLLWSGTWSQNNGTTLPNVCTPVRCPPVDCMVFRRTKVRSKDRECLQWQLKFCREAKCISRTESSCLWQLKLKQVLKLDLALAFKCVRYCSFHRLCTCKFVFASWNPAFLKDLRVSCLRFELRSCRMECRVARWKFAEFSEESAASFARVDDYTPSAQKSVIFITHSTFCSILLFLSAPMKPWYSCIYQLVLKSVWHADDFREVLIKKGGLFLWYFYSLFSYKCVLTYLLTPWCRVLLEKLTGLQLVKKFP